MKKILHVVGGMDRGGVETWLLHVLRHTDASVLRHEFLVHHPGDYDEEVEAAGGRLVHFDTPRHRPARYVRDLARRIRAEGPYDIVHSHVYDLSGAVLLAARIAGVPGRIAHAHRCEVPNQSRVRELFSAAGKAAIRRLATAGLANSTLAAAALFGEDWAEDERFEVVLYGFDFSRFSRLPDRHRIRDELGVPRDALVLGHVGRFVVEKNHALMLEVLAALLGRGENAWLALVGDGQLLTEIQERARELGVADRCRFLGARGDIHRVMAGFDVFLFPSHSEGFGIVAVEAQAAAVPVLTSSTVPREIEVVPEMVERLPLDAPASEWASTVSALARRGTPRDAHARVSQSTLGIHHCVQRLEGVYSRTESKHHHA